LPRLAWEHRDEPERVRATHIVAVVLGWLCYA
jgi:hypothetical protein